MLTRRMRKTRRGWLARGFTLIELSVVLALAAALMALVIGRINSATTSAEVNEAVQMIAELQKAVAQWRVGRSGYSGLTFALLNERELLPNKIGDGSGTNPWGGDYTLAAEVSGYTLTLGLVSTLQSKLLNDVLDPDGELNGSNYVITVGTVSG